MNIHMCFYHITFCMVETVESQCLVCCEQRLLLKPLPCCGYVICTQCSHKWLGDYATKHPCPHCQKQLDIFLSPIYDVWKIISDKSIDAFDILCYYAKNTPERLCYYTIAAIEIEMDSMPLLSTLIQTPDPYLMADYITPLSSMEKTFVNQVCKLMVECRVPNSLDFWLETLFTE